MYSKKKTNDTNSEKEAKEKKSDVTEWLKPIKKVGKRILKFEFEK